MCKELIFARSIKNKLGFYITSVKDYSIFRKGIEDKKMSIKIFADGADLNGMVKEYKRGIVKGFTTNPSLMEKAGIENYKEFAKAVVKNIPDMPVSFEVFSDDLDGMLKEAKVIGKIGENVYIKIPVTNTKGESTNPVIKELSNNGYKVNVTAVFTVDQVKSVLKCLNPDVPSIISVFAGRIADTGIDPEIVIKQSKELCKSMKSVELLWASCREIFNIVQAERSGADIITVQNDILKKLHLHGKDLKEYSLDTVKGFFKDAQGLGFSIL